MKLNAKRQIEGKPACETDFLEGEGWCVELARAANSPELVLLSYRGDADKLEGATALDQGKYALCPPDQDELPIKIERGVPCGFGFWLDVRGCESRCSICSQSERARK
jgi:hypothetical protein